MKRLLKGGRVVDPANGIDGILDIEIDGTRISRVGRDLPLDGASVVEIPAGPSIEHSMMRTLARGAGGALGGEFSTSGR